MGIFNTEDAIQDLKQEYVTEVTIRTNEYTLPIDVEFGSKTTDHIRFKFKPHPNTDKYTVSVGMDNGEVKIFKGNFDKKIQKKYIDRIFRFVQLEWDILVKVYVENLDQLTAKI